jgi:hypothetical protein
VLEGDLHSHTGFDDQGNPDGGRTSSQDDKDIASGLAKNGVDSWFVDPDGTIREVTGSPIDKPVDKLDSSVTGKPSEGTPPADKEVPGTVPDNMETEDSRVSDYWKANPVETGFAEAEAQANILFWTYNLQRNAAAYTADPTGKSICSVYCPPANMGGWALR